MGNNVASCMEAFRDSFLEQLDTPVWSEVCVNTFIDVGQYL